MPVTPFLNDSKFYTEVVKAGIATLTSLAKPLSSTSIQKASSANDIKVLLQRNRVVLTLPSFTSEDVTLKIFNVKGQAVYTKVVNAKKRDVSIPLDDALKVEGVYIAQISSPTFSKHLKFKI